MIKRIAALVVLLSCAPACAYRYIERRVDALSLVLDEATRAGAATCAPVELALSRVHLEFARHELGEGDAPRAERHLTLAEPNGQAALRLAKENECLEARGSARELTQVEAAEPDPKTSEPKRSRAAQRGVQHAKR